MNNLHHATRGSRKIFFRSTAWLKCRLEKTVISQLPIFVLAGLAGISTQVEPAEKKYVGDELESQDISVLVRNLHKTYGTIHAVDDLSFSVYDGEVYSLLGPNGAGKTTTVEIMEGIRKSDSGRVSVLGIDPWHSPSWIRKVVGIMPQDFRFIERITPVEAIKYYCTLFRVPDRSSELIELVELGDAAVNQYQNLSGGEKQKLGICLALISDPKLIFLDEPTTGLDPRARRKIWELIKRLKAESRTVILTTHYLEEAQMLADRVGIVDRGKMLVEGSPKEIIERMGKGKQLRMSKNEKLVKYVEEVLRLPLDVEGSEMYVRIGGNRDIMAILSFIDQNSIELGSMSLVEDTLEDVFVDLVGRQEEE